jgi:hypothetical protein
MVFIMAESVPILYDTMSQISTTRKKSTETVKYKIKVGFLAAFIFMVKSAFFKSII